MRLIDADTLEKDLKSVTLSNGTLINTNTMIALLDKYQTAYDIDKVVSEIRRASGNGYIDIDGDYVPPMIETKKAIEIVKQGYWRRI